MRSEQEISDAHGLISDCLEGLDKLPKALREKVARNTREAEMCGDLLCWVLGHEHPTKFARNLEILRGLKDHMRAAHFHGPQEVEQPQQLQEAQEMKQARVVPRHKHHSRPMPVRET